MKTKIALCLLAGSLLGACQTAPNTANHSAAPRQRLADRMLAQNQNNPNAVGEPAPPAEGPEDIPATRTVDPIRNPALLPTPLLRGNAAAGL